MSLNNLKLIWHVSRLPHPDSDRKKLIEQFLQLIVQRPCRLAYTVHIPATMHPPPLLLSPLLFVLLTLLLSPATCQPLSQHLKDLSLPHLAALANSPSNATAWTALGDLQLAHKRPNHATHAFIAAQKHAPPDDQNFLKSRLKACLDMQTSNPTSYMSIPPTAVTSPTPPPIIVSVPYYICIDTHIPFFYVNQNCDDLTPMLVVIEMPPNPTTLAVEHAATAACSDAIGLADDVMCVVQVMQQISLEVHATEMERVSGTETWRVGHFNVEAKYLDLMQALDGISTQKAGGVEGNVWHWNGFDGTVDGVTNEEYINNEDKRFRHTETAVRMLALKRRCLLTTLAVQLSGDSPKVLEVGFNSGHSAGMVLTTFPTVKVTSFDLCRHWYCEPAHEELVRVFGKDRHELVCGHSHFSILDYVKGKPESLRAYDAVFVDAGHFYVDTLMDILDTAKYAKPGALLVVDDCTTNLWARDDGVHPAEHNVWEYVRERHTHTPMASHAHSDGATHTHTHTSGPELKKAV